MTPIRLSDRWYRRIYLAIFGVSLSLFILFLLHTLNIQYIPSAVAVDFIGGIGSLVVALGALGVALFSKKLSSYWPSLCVYLLFLLVTGYITQHAGGASSGFTVLWALAAFISPLFGAFGWLGVIILTGAYIGGAYLANNGLPTELIIRVIVTSIVPLLAGVLIWRNLGDSADQPSRKVKNLASQLSEVAAKSEIVINAIGDGVIAVDGKGTIQLINPAAQEMLGWGKQDALMLNYKSILKMTNDVGADLDVTQDPIQEVLNTNQQARSNKITAVTNSGKKISISLLSSPIGDPGAGAIAVFRDVTNERLEERQQAEFISTASHEMRTPVASIEGYLGLAINPNTATIDARARDFIMKAHEAAQHLGRLFQDLLDVSKSEDGRLTLTPRIIDLGEFTQTIAQGLTEKADAKGLRLTFVPTAANGTERGIKQITPVYFVNLDKDHIREVLDNLIENAIKYTPEGEVKVDVTGTEDKVIISIKDSGLGIPAEDIPHLFQKFYRVDNVDRQAIGGTGLGLYLCRRLIEAMQGRIWVESEFGSGSTFFIELPRLGTAEAHRLLEEESQRKIQTAENDTPGVTSEEIIGDDGSQPTLGEPKPTPVAMPTPAAAPTGPSTSIPVTFAEPPKPAQPPAAALAATPIAVSAPTPAPASASASAPAQAQPPVQAAAATGAMPIVTAADHALVNPTPLAAPPLVAPQSLAPQSVQTTPASTLTPQPSVAPVAQVATPVPNPTQSAPVMAPAPNATPAAAPLTAAGVKPATTVPRGESLSRDQINERVRQLEALAQQQRGSISAQSRQ